MAGITLGADTATNLSNFDGLGAIPQMKSGTIARTDTTAKNLFTLPAGAIVDDIKIFSPAVSDAATTATISVGKTGSNTFFVNAYIVRTAGTLGVFGPGALAANLGVSVGATSIQVVGLYAETGGASTVGGPFTVTFYYH